MPNRIIREGILTSTKVCSLGFPEEVFYRRLMSIVDDHGRHEATPQLLRAKLYPLQVDTVRVADITRWMAACQKAGLIALYAYPSVAASPRWISADETAGLSVCDGKPYLVLENFGQQVRAKSKCPPPPGSEDERVISSDIACDQLLASASRRKQGKSPESSGIAKSSKIPKESETKEVTPSSDSNCKQMPTSAHLGGGVGNTLPDPPNPTLPYPGARVRDGAFPIRSTWHPSPNFWPMARHVGISEDSEEYGPALADFLGFWRDRPSESRTQAGWEKAFLESWQRYRAFSGPKRETKQNGRPKLSPHSGFAERDYTQGVNPDGSF
ncbi:MULTISPECIES: DnaT-like ssDNA-binding domain-containing protein [Acidithiobacillaceae]|uniref:DnaT DNA-binding domain-containing protein n=1 Tax=Igneacidithiobacillus copahuensis TaxID=2724909 RepID=A0AAE3CK12_9PROT|nr:MULTISPECIES: DnaT-like ssDNA-binding domain-containing protein [Acidithiobacillaceae]MBU2763346.1 hypothetical protein [Acidithiobacillus caldus]MBU2771185.1 hypothetical protein [Acidithiobacillus caldus]MBU2788388.1 hypothetical protein [Igneacidithiobacillus copahuensis]MBU2796374.1 hypothetical protein [Acidithiobacillus sp. VAN18-2]